MDYKYCYVLDFSAEMSCRLELQSAEKKIEDFEGDEDLLYYWGFKPNTCHWMFSNEELDINYINKPLK